MSVWLEAVFWQNPEIVETGGNFKLPQLSCFYTRRESKY
jgi:hypothetical protein